MIRSTSILLYDARNGQKSAIVELVVVSWTVNAEGITYDVRDFAINGDVREFISEKQVSYTWDQINSMDEYLKALYNYKGMTKQEIEFTKVKHGLLLETQTNPVYGSLTSDWLLTENVEDLV